MNTTEELTAEETQFVEKVPSDGSNAGNISHSGLEQMLREQWAKSMGFENSLVQVTAQQGRRDTGGAWTRPDLIVVNVSNFRYVPGRQLDVISFAPKLASEAVVKAVCMRRNALN